MNLCPAILLLLVAFVASTGTASSACPYTALQTKLPSNRRVIVVSDTKQCGAQGVPCVLDVTNCSVLNNDTDWFAIGSYLNYPDTYQHFIADDDKLLNINVDLMEFRPDMTSLGFSYFNFALPNRFQWPQNLSQLHFTGNNFSAMLQSPSTIHSLSYQDNQLNNVTELQTMLPPPLQILNIGKNAYEYLADLNFNRLTHLYLHENHQLRDLANITFSEKLQYLDLSSLALENWFMDSTTFDLLSTLVKRGKNASGQNFSIPATLVGANFTNATSKCSQCNGTCSQPDANIPSFIVCVTGTKLSAGAIAGIVVGAIAFAAMVGIVVFCYMRKRLKKLEQLNLVYGLETTPTWSTGEEAGLTIQDLELVKLDERDLNLHKKLGHGAFADVWLATFQGRSVAVKMLHRSNVTVKQLQSFVDEIKLLASFDSPYIVQLVGAMWTRPSDLKCLMEFMNGGDLRDFLATHRQDQVSWEDKYAHIHNIVEGLVYLHSLNIIHRDLKSRNVLLDSTKGTKLTDFGISKEDLQETMTIGVGTFRWMAPEVIQDLHYTVAADIYSFGMILSEFSTHRIPYDDLKNTTNGQPVPDSAILVKVAGGSIKPNFAADTPEWIQDIAMQCLSVDPEARPTAIQLSHVVRTQFRRMLIV
ncbi:Aste57867_12181 [Aphanomyces stellatus]|uniref:Aste57867_12181 protein n=1 Tax=Aphanomyces stellatus TaxID=120398 RepID=A0A485KVN5_9STRA|nr:hypothetical protein As57867_012136 [Aphanomyces stellatus]VFT89035.1 Aste57867_12181 [Aphanomyces stellatus]